MFASPFFPRSSPFSDPFFDWDHLLQRQWQQQQAYRQQLAQQQQQLLQQQQQQQAQPQQQPTHDCTTACATNCAGNKQTCKPKDNCSTACANLCQLYHRQPQPNNSSTSSTCKAVTPARSFGDLSTFPSWSDLTPQQIQLEWSGTAPSDKEYVVSAYLPAGMTSADANISIDELSRLLTLKCQTKSHQEEKDKNGHIISSHSSSSVTQRSIQIPADVDMHGISASKFPAVAGSMPQAQLILHLPKLQQALPQAQHVKQIPIH